MNSNIIEKVNKVRSNIKEIRQFRNYSQEHVAAKAGIVQNGYCKIESGASAISLERLFLIADALDVDVRDLIYLDIANLPVVKPKKFQY